MGYVQFLRKHMVAILCITILCLCLGFVVLFLAFENLKATKANFDVSFSNVEKASTVKGSDIEPMGKVNILSGGKKIDMQFSLNAIHDEITYLITIENKGSLAAEIVDVVESPDYSIAPFQSVIAPISISLSDIKGKIIPAGEKMRLKMVIYYPSSDLGSVRRDFFYSIGLITKSH